MNNDPSNNPIGAQTNGQPVIQTNPAPQNNINNTPVNQPEVQQPTTVVQPVTPPQPVINQTIPQQPTQTPVVQPSQPIETPPVVNPNPEPAPVMNNVQPEITQPVTNNDLGLKQGEYGIVNDTPTNNTKGKFPIGIIIIVLVVVLALGGGIVWYLMASSPKNIIKNVISGTFKEVNNVIDEYDKVHSKFEYNNQGLLLKGRIKVDSNIFEKEEYKDLKINPSDYYFGINMGISPKEKTFLIGGNIEGTKNKIGMDSFYEDKKLYLTSDYFDKPIVVDLKEQLTTEETNNLDEMFEGFDSGFNQFMNTLEKSTIKPSDLKYLNSTFEKAFINSLDEKKMTKKSGTIEVLGKSIKANKIVYELDKDNLKRTTKSICDALLNDEKALQILASISMSDTDEIKDAIKDYKASTDDIELDKPIYLNIYTTGLTNKFSGIDIEKDGEKVLTYYIDGKNSEITSKSEENKIVINITEEKNQTILSGKLNGQEYMTIVVNTQDPDAIDFSASISHEEVKTKIVVYLKQEVTKSSIKLDFKLGVEDIDNKSSLEGNLELVTTDDKLATKDISSAIAIEKLTENDLDNIYEKLEKATKDDEALTKLYKALKDSIEEAKKNNKKSNSSQLICTGKSGYLSQKYDITYDNDLKEFSNVAVYMTINTNDLTASEAASMNVNNLCSTLKSMDSDISSCSASGENNILKATIKYENDYLSSGLIENKYTADISGVNSLLTNSGYTCTIN